MPAFVILPMPEERYSPFKATPLNLEREKQNLPMLCGVKGKDQHLTWGMEPFFFLARVISIQILLINIIVKKTTKFGNVFYNEILLSMLIRHLKPML